MKLLKTLSAIAIALATVGAVSAQTKIFITGSSAFRPATTTAIDAVLAPGGGTIVKASDSATFTSANAVTWTGGNIGGVAVTIKTSWSGSAAGIQTVGGTSGPGTPFTVGFLPDGAAGTANADPRPTGNPREAASPDIAMSDVYQVATPFNGTFNGVTYANLVDNQVGVVTFVWAASKNFPIGTGTGTASSFSMTPQLAQVLFPGGLIPLSMITGNAANHDTGVIATGRDFDSGTRLTAMAETGVGVSGLLSQYKPTVSAGAVTALALYPRTTINGVDTQVAGNSGEASGSSLRAFLQNTVNVAAAQQVDSSLTGGFLLTYLGVSDYNAVVADAVKLKYNGVDFSQLAVEEGQYTFWGYEHLNYKSNLGNGSTGGPAVKLTFATNLKNTITGSTSAALNPNVSLNDMQVQRFGDGGTVSSLLH